MNKVLKGLTLKVRVDLRGNVPLRDVEDFDFNSVFSIQKLKFFLFP